MMASLGKSKRSEKSEILKEREGDNLGVMVKMGNSLNEILPFLLGDGNISGFPNFNNRK